MTQPNPFNLIMISSEMEHGGNTTQRRFDAHPNCLTYPMESQLGTKFSRNIMIPSIHPVRYGYSEFPEGTTYERAFTLLWDEEVKCYANHRDRSKFRACGMEIDWAKRREAFLGYCSINVNGQYGPIDSSTLPSHARYTRFSRAQVVEAYFRSLFDTWTNLNRSGKETHYVGYNPGMVADTDKLFADFPNAHVIHVVRNPWSAYGDYLKRPFGQQSIEEYCLAYNVAHTLAYNYAAKYPGHFHLVRLEDIMADTRAALGPILDKIGLPWDDALLYPSFNGKDLSAKIAPWGTLDQCTTEYNRAMADSLPTKVKDAIDKECALIIKTFGYDGYASPMTPAEEHPDITARKVVADIIASDQSLAQLRGMMLLFRRGTKYYGYSGLCVGTALDGKTGQAVLAIKGTIWKGENEVVQIQLCPHELTTMLTGCVFVGHDPKESFIIE